MNFISFKLISFYLFESNAHDLGKEGSQSRLFSEISNVSLHTKKNMFNEMMNGMF